VSDPLGSHPVRHRVVLVRPARSVSGGSGGCCSGLVRPFDEGGGHGLCHDTTGGHAPPDGDEVGAVYRALRARLPEDVAVEVVAPSNWLWLLPTLLADGRRRGLSGTALLRTLRRGMAVSSLVVDGAVLFSGRLPEPAQAVAAAEAELALQQALR
jgi:hypothetical protein